MVALRSVSEARIKASRVGSAELYTTMAATQKVQKSKEPVKKRKVEEQERAEAVYLFYTIMAGHEDGSRMYRVPAGDLDDDQLEELEQFNHAYDGCHETQQDKDLDAFVNKIVTWLWENKDAYGRERKIGCSIKKPKDVILDVFTLWLQAL